MIKIFKEKSSLKYSGHTNTESNVYTENISQKRLYDKFFSVYNDPYSAAFNAVDVLYHGKLDGKPKDFINDAIYELLDNIGFQPEDIESVIKTGHLYEHVRINKKNVRNGWRIYSESIKRKSGGSK